MKRWLLGWIGLGLAVCTWAAPRELELVTADWPPFVDASVEGQGLASEIVTQVFAAAGYQVKLRFENWPRAEAMVRQGQAYATFPYIPTPERAQLYDFSDAFLSSSGYFFYYRPRLPKPPQDYRELSDLRGLRIGSPRGYWYEPLFRRAGIRLQYVEKEIDVFRLLVRGALDLAPMTDDVGWYLLRKYLPAEADGFAVLDKPLNSDSGMGLLVSRAYPDAARITADFNRALAAFRTEGKLDALRLRYRQRLTTGH